MVDKEITLLQSALHESFGNNSRTLIASKAAEFFEVRQARYKKIVDSGISLNEGRSCASAEAQMELIEGAADFVGLYSAQNSGVLSKAEIEKYLDLAIHSGGGPGELYYRFGSIALLVMRNSDPIGFPSIVTKIKNAKNIEQTVIRDFLNWSVSPK